MIARKQEIQHRGVRLTFSVPNTVSKYRAESFSDKEPETLEWIEGIPFGSVVWDIGANVGLYTCYAAKARGCRVFAFEPSVFNLELLARNVFLNGLTGQVTIVPLPLSDELALNKLNMTSTVWGGAMSSFGQSYDYDGQQLHIVFEFPTIGLSMPDATNLLKIPKPDYIKMDVDGIEHLILKGGGSILLGAKAVLLEINDRFTVQATDSRKYLQEAGFFLKEKRHADCYNTDSGPGRFTFNQIWTK
jgi:FkbM family methyltransferase